MRIQSAGTGLVDGAFFSFLGEPLDVAVEAAGLGVELVLAGALAAGLDPQPAATSAVLLLRRHRHLPLARTLKTRIFSLILRTNFCLGNQT